MRPMLMMKQRLNATYDQGPLLMHGAKVKFTKFEQFAFHCHNKNSTKYWSLALNSVRRYFLVARMHLRQE